MDGTQLLSVDQRDRLSRLGLACVDVNDTIDWDVDQAIEALEEDIQEDPEGAGLVPMMNYIWPVDLCGTGDDPEEAQTSLMLAHCALCLVYYRPVEGLDWEVGLALTGGGMDLSWDIARAYIALGQLPPARLSLPEFAGMDFREPNTAFIIEALKRSHRRRIGDSEHQIENLDRMLERSGD